MFVDEQSNLHILADLNTTVSRATHRKQDLIPAFLDVLQQTPEYEQIRNIVPSYAMEDNYSEWWDSEDACYILEDLFDTLNNYAPEGYYFGAHPGDGSDYGYWENEEDA